MVHRYVSGQKIFSTKNAGDGMYRNDIVVSGWIDCWFMYYMPNLYLEIFECNAY